MIKGMLIMIKGVSIMIKGMCVMIKGMRAGIHFDLHISSVIFHGCNIISLKM